MLYAAAMEVHVTKEGDCDVGRFTMSLRDHDAGVAASMTVIETDREPTRKTRLTIEAEDGIDILPHHIIGLLARMGLPLAVPAAPPVPTDAPRAWPNRQRPPAEDIRRAYDETTGTPSAMAEWFGMEATPANRKRMGNWLQAERLAGTIPWRGPRGALPAGKEK